MAGAVSLYTSVRSAAPLLFGLSLLMLGNGLQGTLLGVRATLEGFSTDTTGFVMAAYFGGFLAGSIVVPGMLRNVGHIRVFAALASIASGAVLMHVLIIHPLAWGVFRLVTGFCFAGLYVITESWLNDIATNRTRGQLLSVYMVVVTGGIAGGQFLLPLSDPGSFELFILISVLVSLSLVPTSLSVKSAPSFEAPQRVGLRALYAISPLGVVGALGVGVAHSALFSMGAVYGQSVGMSNKEISVFLALIFLGGMVMQWPVGYISDRMDRRQLILALGAVAAIMSMLALPAWVSEGDRLWLFAIIALLGAASLPLYSLCIAHANDYLEPEQIVAASSTLVLVGSIGLTLGPLAAGLLMTRLGPQGLFWGEAFAHVFIVVFTAYRMMRREAPSVEDQHRHATITSRTTPLAAALSFRFAREKAEHNPAGRG